MQQVELLSPAGNAESFYGAINAGADAVYLAGDRFGARAYADNFSTEELIKCLRYANLLHKKIYLTVNTLLKEEELESLPAFLRPFVEEGLGGVILQDFGVLRCIREAFPELPLHASTQMSVTGENGAKFLKSLGVSRVVPARELSLEEIRVLKQQSGLEIETFIHGAMCYCYSGQCLFSSILGGRSGNRGRCAQPCRLPYKILHDGKAGAECYPLSLKDLCTIELMPDLINAGIDSFKIEGRMKKPEYVAGVTAYYRKYIDQCLEGKDCRPSKKDLSDLSRLYVRGELGTGYYNTRNGRSMVSIESPAYVASDEALLESIKAKYLADKKRLPVQIQAFLGVGSPASILIFLEDSPHVSAYVEGDEVQAAKNAPLSKESIVKQLSKLGDSSFYLRDADSISVEMDGDVFCSLKGLNELRRKAIAALEEVIIHDNANA
ncbi:MAG: U32 family peptidase [Lachnospiraceae bacterium]|nr:U32 family peptidase [Lachnospiraceae bacterium]